MDKTRKHLSFRDKFDREIIPYHVRAKLSGDVFLSYDLDDIPPAGARVELRVQAIAMPPTLVPQGEEGMGPYIAVVPLRAREGRDMAIVVPEPGDTDQVRVEDLLPEGADSARIRHPASGTSVKIEREPSKDGNGTRRSAQKAKAASRKRTAKAR